MVDASRPTYIPRVRSQVERVADVALACLIAAAGAIVALTPVLMLGLVLGGSACGGGGSAQRCTAIARQLSLVDISPRAWAYVVGGALAVLGAVALLVARCRDVRILVSLSVLCVAFVCLVQTTQVDAKLGPSEGGTYGRSLEDWGGFLSPALVELREDALRRYEGRPTEPGGPLYDPDQILSSFSVRGLDGWHLLYAAVVVLFFAAGLATVRRLVRRPFLALVITSTAGLVIWAATVDGAGQCNADAGECYRGIATFLALVVAALVWGLYAAGIGVRRLVGRSVSYVRRKREDRQS